MSTEPTKPATPATVATPPVKPNPAVTTPINTTTNTNNVPVANPTNATPQKVVVTVTPVTPIAPATVTNNPDGLPIVDKSVRAWTPEMESVFNELLCIKEASKAAPIEAKLAPPNDQLKPTKGFDIATQKPVDLFQFDEGKCLEKLDAVKENLLKYEGKPGYNPYFYMVEKVNPLQKRLLYDKTESLQNEILALDANHVPEAAGNVGKENRERGCVEPQSSGRSHALGQHVGAGYRN